MDSCAIPSQQLLEANQRLQALRTQVQSQRQLGDCRELPWQGIALSSKGFCTESLDSLPKHLGWGSEALTAVLRRREQTKKPVGNELAWIESLRGRLLSDPPDAKISDANCTNENNFAIDNATWGGVNDCGNSTRTHISKKTSSTTQNLQSTRSYTDVKLYPDIGLGMLRQEMTAPGRLWLMLRYLDKEGRGVLRVDIIIKLLTTDSSRLHICGKRQLRNLLHDGEGVFWTRDKVHIWLHSAAKVAHALEVHRLTGNPVTIPLKALLSGIGTFRAHLYEAFHSGRLKVSPYGKRAVPIARDTLTELSGVGRSSQRAYEAKVGLQVQSNFAVCHLSTQENREKYAWAQGQALFELKDYHGQQGKKGRTYLAWQLPNSYSGQHQHRPKGRQKRINRELNDLVMKGMPGNVEETDETQMPEKIYFPNGKLAAKAYDRDPEQDLYWKRGRTRNGRFELWQGME